MPVGNKSLAVIPSAEREIQVNSQANELKSGSGMIKIYKYLIINIIIYC